MLQTFLNDTYNRRLITNFDKMTDEYAHSAVLQLSVETKKNALSFKYAFRKRAIDKDVLSENQEIFQLPVNHDSIWNYQRLTDINMNISLLEGTYSYHINQTDMLTASFSHFKHKMPKYRLDYLLNGVTDIDLNKQQETVNKKMRFGLTYSKKINKWLLSASTHLESLKMEGDFIRYRQANDTSFTVEEKGVFFTPSARMSYFFSPHQQCYLGYSLTQSIGDVEDYIAFVEKQNPFHWYTGNPNLKPERQHNVYLAYQYDKKIMNAKVEMFYKHNSNAIDRISYLIAPLTYISSPENIAIQDNIGLDISAHYKFHPKWYFNFSTQINHQNIQLDENNPLVKTYPINLGEYTQKSLGGLGKLDFGFHDKKLFSAGLYFNYYAKQIDVRGYTKPYWEIDFAISRRFLDDKLFINFAIEHLFSQWVKRERIEDYYNTYSQIKLYDEYTKPVLYLYITYHLFNGNRGTSDIKTTGIE